MSWCLSGAEPPGGRLLKSCAPSDAIAGFWLQVAAKCKHGGFLGRYSLRCELWGSCALEHGSPEVSTGMDRADLGFLSCKDGLLPALSLPQVLGFLDREQTLPGACLCSLWLLVWL